MQIAFIHISDFHFREHGQSFHSYACNIVRAVRSIFPQRQRIHPILVVTGDLAFSGKKDQYLTVGAFLDAIIEAIEESFGMSPNLLMVPGNHDVCNPWENTLALEDWLEQSRDEMELALRLELEKSEAYYSFARDRGILTDDIDGSSIMTLQLEDDAETVQVRVDMLSSSPFSSLGNDCGKHHLLFETTSRVQQTIQPGERTSYNILLMHHPEYWFDDGSRVRLRAAISKYVDFLFTGHEHQESHSISVEISNDPTFVSRCGQLSRDNWQTSAFSCVAFDTRTHVARKHEFLWNAQQQFYVQTGDIKPTLVFPKGGFRPKLTYLQELVTDTLGISNTIMDYFEFPSLRISGHSGNRLLMKGQPSLNEATFFEELGGLQVVNIYGDRNSGKSTLLKYLYIRSLDFGYAPLFLDSDTATRSFERSFQGIIATQYGESDVAKSRYQQLDYNCKMLLIDDFHALRKRSKDGDYLSAALESVSTVIVVTDAPLFQDDARDGASTLSAEDSLCYLRLGSFTKSRRDRLVARVCASRSIDVELRDQISNAVNDSVARYRTLFPLNPGFIIQYLKYGLNETDPVAILARCSKPFGEVYQGNIKDALSSVGNRFSSVISSEQLARLAMGFLSELAYNMHEARHASLTHSGAITAIRTYLDACDVEGVQPLDVLDFISESGILVKSRVCDEIRFGNVNHFAFFIAKKIDSMMSNPRRTEDEQWHRCLERLYNEICYGVNESVLLFLSYMKEDAFLPVELCARTESLLSRIRGADDFSFAHRTAPLNLSMADDSDRNAVNQIIDERELAYEENRLDAIEYHDIYDYDVPSTSDDDPLLITRASKYMVMAVRAYSMQIMNMRRTDKNRIVDALYTAGAKIVGIMSMRYGDTFEDTVSHAYVSLEKVGSSTMSRDEIANVYSSLLVSVGLNVLDSMVQPISDELSAKRMLKRAPESILDRIVALLILSHRNDPNSFCTYSINLMERAVRDGSLGDQYAISLIVYVYVINHPHLSRRHLDRLADKIFNDKDRSKRKRLLLLRHRV